MAALIGAVGFELLKLLLSGYLQGVAAKSMYGAFGVPIALLLWINFTAKLLLYCAAWTATQQQGDAGRGHGAGIGGERRARSPRAGQDPSAAAPGRRPPAPARPPPAAATGAWPHLDRPVVTPAARPTDGPS